VTGPGRVLVVGLDAVDPGIATHLVGTGRMPALASLLDRGVGAPLATPEGLFVGAVWPSITTGASPARHGRYCYEQLRPGTYEVHRVGGIVEPCTPFWVAAARAGRRTIAIDVPHSDLDEELDVHVVDWAVHDRNVGFRTWPRELGLRLVGDHGRPLADQCNEYARRGALGPLRDDLVTSIRAKAELVADIGRAGEWDLLTVVFGEGHCAGHQFWALHDRDHPRHDRERARALGDPLIETYAELDTALGTVVGEAPDALVLVVLSHGMGPHYDATFLLGEMLRRIEDVDGPPSRPIRVREAARRRVRRAQRWRRAGSESFVSAVDGSRRFFTVPNNDVHGGVRINLVGREPAGRVLPGVDFDQTCALVTDALADWRNVETGTTIVQSVTRTELVYSGPASAHLPDLIVNWDRSVPINAVESPRHGRIDRGYAGVRTGDHRPGGLLVAYGPAVRTQRHAGAVVLESADVAPTVCAALDVPLPDVDGKAWRLDTAGNRADS
jgi:predicted AlkP superfamily phosphohydrolase/phosphomutase